jgi:hypothetical protein
VGGELSTRGRVSRRSLAKGAAWAAPVVVVGASAPAFAVSGTPPTLSQNGDACKLPGSSCPADKGYIFPVLACNSDPLPIYIYTVTYGLPYNFGGGTPPSPFVYINNPNNPLPILIPAGGCVQLDFLAQGTNSANQSFNMDVCITWGHTLPTGSDTEHPPTCATLFVDRTRPCNDCQTPLLP